MASPEVMPVILAGIWLRTLSRMIHSPRKHSRSLTTQRYPEGLERLRGRGIWELGRIGDVAGRGARSRHPGQFTRQRVQGVHGAEHPQRAIDTGILDQFHPSPIKLPRLIRGSLAVATWLSSHR